MSSQTRCGRPAVAATVAVAGGGDGQLERRHSLAGTAQAQTRPVTVHHARCMLLGAACSSMLEMNTAGVLCVVCCITRSYQHLSSQSQSTPGARSAGRDLLHAPS
jgi:hypothetical protein